MVRVDNLFDQTQGLIARNIIRFQDGLFSPLIPGVNEDEVIDAFGVRVRNNVLNLTLGELSYVFRMGIITDPGLTHVQATRGDVPAREQASEVNLMLSLEVLDIVTGFGIGEPKVFGMILYVTAITFGYKARMELRNPGDDFIQLALL